MHKLFQTRTPFFIALLAVVFVSAIAGGIFLQRAQSLLGPTAGPGPTGTPSADKGSLAATLGSPTDGATATSLFGQLADLKNRVDAIAPGGGGTTINWITTMKHFFVTATTYNGALGGIGGASAKCNIDANALPGKTYHVVQNPDSTWNVNSIGLWNSTLGESTNITVIGADSGRPYGCGQGANTGKWDCGNFYNSLGVESGLSNVRTPSESINKYRTQSRLWATWTSFSNCNSWTDGSGSLDGFENFTDAGYLIGLFFNFGFNSCNSMQSLLCVED